MMKRLISLTLCLLMVMAAFVACASGEDEEVAVSDATTLVMMVVTEDKVNYTEEELAAMSSSDRLIAEKRIEQYEAVEAEINKTTQSKFKTKLEIVYCTEDEYYETLEAKLAANSEIVELQKKAADDYKKFKRSNREVRDENELYKMFIEKYPEHEAYYPNPAAVVENTELGDGVYPEATPDQVDILFIGSYDKYVEYYNNEWLQDVTSQFNGVAKKLKSYIYPAFLDAAKIGKSYFAVPNNTLVGEYTVMLVNKDMCDKYSDISQIISTLYSPSVTIFHSAFFSCLVY